MKVFGFLVILSIISIIPIADASRLAERTSQTGDLRTCSTVADTFKENCPDLRNTRVVDMVSELTSYGAEVEVYDPWINPEQAIQQYDISPTNELDENGYDAVILAVAHEQFLEMGVKKIRALCSQGGVLYDVKSIFPAEKVDGREPWGE